MTYTVGVVADSVDVHDHRLTTLEVTFPRFILAEFNTHRMLSRNSASSRAIPVEKRIAAVKTQPFIPDVFGANQRGMQALSQIDDDKQVLARAAWMNAMRDAANRAEQLAELGVHKQLANRLLEPFLWHTCIVTATDWDNFFHLRDHADAQPEFQKIAAMMKRALADSVPNLLKRGEWHLPYITEEDLADERFGHDWESICMISTARCARVSYLTHDGRRDLSADTLLGLKLMKSGHMSPFEHPAMCMADFERRGNFIGWKQYRKFIPMEHDRLAPMRIIQGSAPNPPVTKP